MSENSMTERNQYNIHVVVADSSVLYCDYLIENFRHTATRKENLKFYCYALDHESHQRFASAPAVVESFPVYRDIAAYRRETWRDWKVFLQAQIGRQPMLGGSNGHSAGLNAIMQKTRSLPGHHIIADSDVAIITHGWDDKIEVLFEQFHLIGTTYEGKNGFSSGTSEVQTYKNFPNANWLAVREDCDLADLDWFPRKERHILIDDADKSQLYGLPIGYQMVCDGGWRLPSFCRERGYFAKSMRHVKPSSPDCRVILTAQDYNEEYQLDGVPFVAHQRGGSRHVFREAEVSVGFYDCVEKAVGVPLADKVREPQESEILAYETTGN